MPARAAAWSGLLPPIAFIIGWTFGGLAQPEAYSSLDHSVGDLGALTADHAWLYNHVGANLAGLLVVGFALGLWPVVADRLSGRLGVGAVALMGAGQFLDGFLRLECREIDIGCEDSSWHATAHGIESTFTLLGFALAPFLLWRALRGHPSWRELSRVCS